MHFAKRSGFAKGRLYLAAASFKRPCIIVLSLTVVPAIFNLFAMSRAVTNVCCSERETIYSSCLEVVARARPNRIESVKSSDCFHRLSHISPLSCHI